MQIDLKETLAPGCVCFSNTVPAYWVTEQAYKESLAKPSLQRVPGLTLLGLVEQSRKMTLTGEETNHRGEKGSHPAETAHASPYLTIS